MDLAGRQRIDGRLLLKYRKRFDVAKAGDVLDVGLLPPPGQPLVRDGALDMEAVLLDVKEVKR